MDRRPERHPRTKAGVRGRRLAAWVVLAAVLAGPPRITASAAASEDWATLIEFDTYGGAYPDLPVGDVNSTRMLSALMRRGWPVDHVLVLRDSADRTALSRAAAWLAARVRPGDTALLYVAGEYQFFEHELHWDAAFPALWGGVPTPRRVLIVETCFAERLGAAADSLPGLALPAVGRDELDWWGLRDSGRVMRGASFSYFLARALEQQPADSPADFAAAFAAAAAGTREYFRGVIAATPSALASFHARGSYPERMPAFPNPHLLEHPESGTP